MFSIHRPDRETVTSEKLLPLWTILALIAAAGASEIGPELGEGLAEHRWWLRVPVAISLFGLGCLIRPADLMWLRERWVLVLAMTSVRVIAGPAIAILIAWMWDLPAEWKRALVLFAALPGFGLTGASSVAARGYLPLSLGVTLLGSMIWPLTIPLSLYAAGEVPAPNTWASASSVVLWELLLPLLAGMVLGRALPEFRELAGRNGRFLVYFPMLVFVTLATAAFSVWLPWASLDVFAAVIATQAALMVVAYQVGGWLELERPLRRALALQFGVPNALLGLAVCNLSGAHAPAAMVTLGLGGIGSLLIATCVGAYWAQWIDRRGPLNTTPVDAAESAVN